MDDHAPTPPHTAFEPPGLEPSAFRTTLAHLNSFEPLNPDDGPSIEALVAAILDKKHTLSAEDLAVFEDLLDAPDLAPEQRQEFLQTVWAVVVSIIDWQWETALASTVSTGSGKSCGSKSEAVKMRACPDAAMVSSRDEELSQSYNESAQIPRGKEAL